MTFAPASSVRASLRIEVFNSLETAERVWRRLEALGGLTPYQRYDWIKAFVDAGGECDGPYSVAAIFDKDRAIALLPLIIERRFGVTRGRIPGSCISNSDWIIVDPEDAEMLTRPVLTWALSTVGKAVGGLDLVTFSNQPRVWNGITNPVLAFQHEPSPSNLYFTPIEARPEPFIDYGVNSKRRSNILRAMRRLVETHGSVEFRRAETIAEVERIHSVFLKQRGRRFEEMGIENIFAEEWFRTFFRTLGTLSLGQENRALAFYALYAGDEILATCVGAFSGTHYSQYINSTSDGPEARLYLIGIQMVHLMDELKSQGITSMDMGLGDFTYKGDWTTRISVCDTVIPVTMKGRIAAPCFTALRGMKRAIKQNEKLWAFAQRVRHGAYRARRILERQTPGPT